MSHPRGVALLCLWPGLPQIWLGQLARGLVVAVIAALVLNGAIIASWIWTELLAPPVLFVMWVGIGALWVTATGWSLWSWHGRTPEAEPQWDQLYRAALEHYLGRRWPEAEQLWKRIVNSNPADCDALLHLASVYRRSGQPAMASRCLRLCQHWDAEGQWSWELEQERQWLNGAGPHSQTAVASSER